MEKEKIVLFGAGGSGKKLYKEYKEEYDIVAFADNFKTGELFGLPILRPEELLTLEYDAIIIAATAYASIKQKLLELGIKRTKILSSYIEIAGRARDTFIKQLASEVYRKKYGGAVAEAGVFQGDFAALINQYFPNKKLYLFDTFIGFDDRDIEKEENYELNPARGEYFKQTSVELVLSKMRYPKNVIVRQGYVPETLEGLEEEFCFVNLDMDLYQPTLEALRWFWPRMISGGVILVHDYFDETGTFPNLRKAVTQFTDENQITSIPIGDNLSIALIKNKTSQIE